MLSLFPRDVLDEIWDLIRSVFRFLKCFYLFLMYKIRKIIDKNEFPYHFIKITALYKKIGYNIDVLRQTVCLVVNLIKLIPLFISLIAQE